MEEDFWRQKATVRWISEGEHNTRFFHGFVKQKRCQSHIHAIKIDGRVVSDESELRDSSASLFQNLFSTDSEFLAQAHKDYISSIPSSVDLFGLYDLLSQQEIRDAVFGFDSESVSGPDGFSSLFFQHYWEIVR